MYEYQPPTVDLRHAYTRAVFVRHEAFDPLAGYAILAAMLDPEGKGFSEIELHIEDLREAFHNGEMPPGISRADAARAFCDMVEHDRNGRNCLGRISDDADWTLAQQLRREMDEAKKPAPMLRPAAIPA